MAIWHADNLRPGGVVRHIPGSVHRERTRPERIDLRWWRWLHLAADERYEHMEYRRCGRSGLKLPFGPLGLWQNFGDARPPQEIDAMLTRAFDLGITHFDLANNYGPPTARPRRVLAGS
jgi:hypothetical protein